jgi:hypothetical protein
MQGGDDGGRGFATTQGQGMLIGITSGLPAVLDPTSVAWVLRPQ